MSFIYSPPVGLDSPHQTDIMEIRYHSKTEIFSSLSRDCLSFWNKDKLIGTVSAKESEEFLNGAFISDTIYSVYTTKNQILLISIVSFEIEDKFISFTAPAPIVFFKKVGKYLFILCESGHAFYISLSTFKCKTNDLKISSKIISAQNSNAKLYLLLEDHQLLVINQSDVTLLSLTASSFFVSSDYLYILSPSGWELWALSPLSLISPAEDPKSAVSGFFSPEQSTSIFFKNDHFSIFHFKSQIDTFSLPGQSSSYHAQFDLFGRILFISVDKNLYFLNFATSSSLFLSPPLTCDSVLLPFRDRLAPVPLPLHSAKQAILGDSHLAVNFSKKCIAVFRFPHKTNDTFSVDNQFIRSPSIDFTSYHWEVIRGIKVQLMTWSGSKLFIISLDQEKVHHLIGYDFARGVRLFLEMPLSISPVSIAANSQTILLAAEKELETYSMSEKPVLIQRTAVGEKVKRALFVNNETIAVQTNDRRLLLIFHSQIVKEVNDVTSFQVTGSINWPLLLIGSTSRLLGANSVELPLESDMERHLLIGVDRFSFISIAPKFENVTFAHLVISQSLVNDSLASAVSIVSQERNENRVDILKRVSAVVDFEHFLPLVDRFASIEDEVIAYVVHQNPDKELWNLALGRGWFKTAAELVQYAEKEECAELMMKSEFADFVLIRVKEIYPELLEPTSLSDKLRWKIEDEAVNSVRHKLVRYDFRSLVGMARNADYLTKRALIRLRREQLKLKLMDVIENMKSCNGQELLDLGVVFDQIMWLEIVFGTAWCLKNYSKCLECLEKDPLIVNMASKEMLAEIGY